MELIQFHRQLKKVLADSLMRKNQYNPFLGMNFQFLMSVNRNSRHQTPDGNNPSFKASSDNPLGDAHPFTALYLTTLNCTVLHCTSLHCTELHCTPLHSTAIYNSNSKFDNWRPVGRFAALHATLQFDLQTGGFLDVLSRGGVGQISLNLWGLPHTVNILLAMGNMS